jgi:adenylate cyclase
MSGDSTTAKAGYRQTLRFTIVSVFTLLLVATVLAVVIGAHGQSSKAMRGLTDVIFTRVATVVNGRTGGFLAPARGLVEVHARQYEAGALVVDGEKPFELLAAFADVLALYPEFAFLYFASPDGDQLAAERVSGDRFVLWQVIEGAPEERRIIRTTVDGAGAVLGEEVELDPSFRITERPWFIGARDQNGTVWSDPYVFFASRPILGITVSHPVRGPDGEFAGVFGADVDLASLSGFLGQLQLGETGMALVMNADGQPIAFPGYSEWIAANPDADGLPSPDALGLPWVDDALAAISPTGGHTVHTHGEVEWLVRALPMEHIPGATWYVMVAAPKAEFVGRMWETNRKILAGSLVALLLGMLAVGWVSRGISRPVVALAAETQRVKDFDLSPSPPIRSRIVEVQLLADAVRDMKVGLGAFMRYMPSNLVRQVIEAGEEVKVGGREVELTIFFSDVQGFTTFSEGLEPQALMELLSEYLEVMTTTLQEHGATVDKYIGDGVMAFWGAPLPDADHAVHACRAAVECQRRLDELNQRWVAEGRFELVTRVGIHTGRAVVGNVGSTERLNYTAMGDNVNIAARLEGANKQFGTRIMISAATRDHLGDGFETRPLGDVELKGKTVALQVFELKG